MHLKQNEHSVQRNFKNNIVYCLHYYYILTTLSMIEHVSLPVSDYNNAKAFYAAALKPLGYELSMEHGEAGGFKADGHTSFWIVKKDAAGDNHVAFRAKDRATVEAFYNAALAAGAKDNGAPGLRPDYSPDYYAAFILDADNNNIEVVTFEAA